MILLVTTSDIIELLTTSTASTDYCISYVDFTSTTYDAGISTGNISSATTTTILSAPASSTRRQVKFITIRNKSTTASQTITIKYDVSGTERYLTTDLILQPGFTLEYIDGQGFTVKGAQGRQLVLNNEIYSSLTFDYRKIGTVSEAVGRYYGFAKDAGYPGAWVPGSPGVNGYWTDASDNTNAANPAGATETGCYQLQTPKRGGYYLTGANAYTSTVHNSHLIDLLWYNTGLAVTTTTSQSISQPTDSIPDRDLFGSSKGVGWRVGIYVTTATTNGSAVTNTTLTYTNSDGTGSRTATILSFPATAVAGTFVPFDLQVGDNGIRSIQSITLGTSYGGGAISLVMYREITELLNCTAYQGALLNDRFQPHNIDGIRIFNGTCFWWLYQSTATTATTFEGCLQLVEK
jgi:hypothetical protein